MNAQEPLLRLAGVDVFQDPAPSNRVHYVADMDVDCDGARTSYRLDNSYKRGALDSIRASAGYPNGQWWNVLVRDPKNANRPFVDPDGFCISMTSYQREQFDVFDRRRYVDALTIPYAVAPGSVRRRCRGVICGCRAKITDTVTDRSIECVTADFSGGNIGEAGMAAATFFDPELSPRNGDGRSRYLYEFFPGVVPSFVDPETGEPFKLIRLA
jgi:hypothetical protein